MSSILLGPLANSRANPKNKLNSTYNSNISDKMNIIESQQLRQKYNKPEFLKQFDQLTFDSIGDPVGINESYMSTKGVNSSLQRNIDFNNGYSNFQKTDMHYDVINKDKFTHNNMIPSTSRRDFSRDFVHADRAQRKLENFTGIDPNYVSKKEKIPLFEPLPNLTWVNGMPVVTDKLVNRFLPSNKNNYGDLPFESNVKVRPGIEFQNQQGDYAVYRVNPRTVDALRSEINQKVSYENKPLETIKKGEIRAPDPKLSKYKLPDFRQTNFGDLLPSRADIEGPKQTGSYTNVTSQRNETESYYAGHAVNTNKGDGPDKGKTRFEPAKRESYKNDPTHAINAVNNKPVMTNASSFTNYENQRASTNIDYEGPASNAVIGGGSGYTVDYKDIPLTTIRELMIHSDNNIGVVGSQQQSNYIFSNDMVLPTTHRESTNHNIVSNARGEEKQNPIYNGDLAKTTLRPGTSHNIVSNTRGEEKNAPVYNGDLAKTTLRPGTSYNLAINVAPTEGTGYSELTDRAKNTIRQTTSYTTPEINIKGYINDIYSNLQDKAKPTIKQTTLISKRPTGNPSKALAGYSRDKEDEAKPTIRQTTENTQQIGHANAQHGEAGYARDKEDKAKPTIRQTTENTQQIGHANAQNIEAGYTRDINDEARPTIKQTTLYSSPAGRMNNSNMGNYTRDKQDEARVTIKQTTLLEDYTGGLHGEVDAQISHEAANNMETDERRELSAYNRAPNGKGDLNGPYLDRENVRMNDKKELYSYVSHPYKPLDMSVMPTTSRDTIQNIYSMSKPVIETSSYYVNPYFINTLKNNPLVNDIYHQKNV